jgi:hypothetical protein
MSVREQEMSVEARLMNTFLRRDYIHNEAQLHVAYEHSGIALRPV